VGKYSFAATSLVAAVPAAALAAIVVMQGFLKYVSDMNGIMLALSGGVLGASAFVVLIPFGILIFGGSKKKRVVPEKPAAKAGAESLAAAADASEADVSVLDPSGEAMIVDSDVDAVTLDDDDIEATTDFTTPVSGTDLGDDDIVFDADSDEFAEIDEISDEVILEDDEDDTPRKKRR
jgi:hypothetical protein